MLKNTGTYSKVNSVSRQNKLAQFQLTAQKMGYFIRCSGCVLECLRLWVFLMSIDWGEQRFLFRLSIIRKIQRQSK